MVRGLDGAGGGWDRLRPAGGVGEQPGSARRPCRSCPEQPRTAVGESADAIAGLACWAGANGGEAVGGAWRDGPGSTLAFDPHRAAMRMRRRGCLRVAEDVVHQRHQGADRPYGYLEHMFVSLRRAADGIAVVMGMFGHRSTTRSSDRRFTELSGFCPGRLQSKPRGRHEPVLCCAANRGRESGQMVCGRSPASTMRKGPSTWGNLCARAGPAAGDGLAA